MQRVQHITLTLTAADYDLAIECLDELDTIKGLLGIAQTIVL